MYRLKRGAADLNAFKLEAEKMTEGNLVQFVIGSIDAAHVRRSIHLQAVALRLFAGLTALAALLILGQAFSRQVTVARQDHPALHAMGMTVRSCG